MFVILTSKFKYVKDIGLDIFNVLVHYTYIKYQLKYTIKLLLEQLIRYLYILQKKIVTKFFSNMEFHKVSHFHHFIPLSKEIVFSMKFFCLHIMIFNYYHKLITILL